MWCRCIGCRHGCTRACPAMAVAGGMQPVHAQLRGAHSNTVPQARGAPAFWWLLPGCRGGGGDAGELHQHRLASGAVLDEPGGMPTHSTASLMGARVWDRLCRGTWARRELRCAAEVTPHSTCLCSPAACLPACLPACSGSSSGAPSAAPCCLSCPTLRWSCWWCCPACRQALGAALLLVVLPVRRGLSVRTRRGREALHACCALSMLGCAAEREVLGGACCSLIVMLFREPQHCSRQCRRTPAALPQGSPQQLSRTITRCICCAAELLLQ